MTTESNRTSRRDHDAVELGWRSCRMLTHQGARTRRIRLVPDVADLPMRSPAMLAKAAASLGAT